MPRTRSIAWSELKIGVVGVVAAAARACVIVAVGGEGGFWWQRYPLKTQFADAQGLKTGAVVRLSGKEVGTVTAVEFAGAADRGRARGPQGRAAARHDGLGRARSDRSACSASRSSTSGRADAARR